MTRRTPLTGRTLITCIAVIALLAGGCNAAFAIDSSKQPFLSFSTDANRTMAKALSHATVQGSIYIFLTGDTSNITAASYYFDNPTGVGHSADATVAPDRSPGAIDTSKFPPGIHTMLVMATTKANTTFDVFARFSISASSVAETPATSVAPRIPAQTSPTSTSDNPGTTPSAAPKTGTQVCDKFGSTKVAGGAYMVQNNVWGDDTQQCITAFDTGFRVDKASHNKSSGPAAYPSIMSGCWMGTCTTGTKLPIAISSLPAMTTSWSTTTPNSGKYNIAYDIWADPTPRKTGQNTGAELMIWLKQQGGIAPIGSKTASAQIGGAQWDVWTGKNGATPVISWVRQQPTQSVTNLPINDFVKDASTRGIVKDNWYLTNIQAGFEPWQGGQGLTVNSFSVN